MLRDVTGLAAELRFDPSKPDGTPRKLLEVSRIKALGWAPKIGLAEGCRHLPLVLRAPPRTARELAVGPRHRPTEISLP